MIELNSLLCGYIPVDPIGGELPGGGLGSGGPAGGRGDEFMGGTGGSFGGGGGTGGGVSGRTIYEYDTLDRQNLADGGMGREPMEFQ